MDTNREVSRLVDPTFDLGPSIGSLRLEGAQAAYRKPLATKRPISRNHPHLRERDLRIGVIAAWRMVNLAKSEWLRTFEVND